MRIERFDVKKDDLAHTRRAETTAPELAPGEIRVAVERFALTANNITYAIVGDRLGYWQFFPVADGWGNIPVWGFAEVIESRHGEIGQGERLFGYFPMASHLQMTPVKVNGARLVDGAAHRTALPPVYNVYTRVANEASYDAGMDNEQMLLLPLYRTAFCLADFLLDNRYFGASQVVISSASSRTAVGLAYALVDAGLKPVALTSAGHLAGVQALELYDAVFDYGNLSGIDNSKATVIVDMSGNGTVLSDLHAHLGDNMKFTSNVGLTHYTANRMGADFRADRSAMFFAPDHVRKRARDWGPGEFERRSFEFWHSAAIRSRQWLSIEEHAGMGAIESAYVRILAGSASPRRGTVIRIRQR